MLGLAPWAGSWGGGLCGRTRCLPTLAPRGSSRFLFPVFFLLPGPQGSLSEADLDILAGLAEGAPLPTANVGTHMLAQSCFRSRLSRSTDLVQLSVVGSNHGVGPLRTRVRESRLSHPLRGGSKEH